MPPEPENPKPQSAPQRPAPAPMPQRAATPAAAPARGRSRAMTFVYGAVVVAVLAVGAVATGLVHVPGFGPGAGAPATSVTQQADVQQVDEGDHTIGVRIWTVTPDLAKERQLSRSSGVVILEVPANSPAEKAGLRANDVVVAVDGIPVRGWEDLSTKVRLTPIGQQFSITFDRAGATETHSVTIARCLVREAPKAPGIGSACQSWTQ